MLDNIITLQEAKGLMTVLENDIPEYDKSKIALLLLILVANPSLVEQGEKIITSSFGRTKFCWPDNRDSYYDDY